MANEAKRYEDLFSILLQQQKQQKEFQQQVQLNQEAMKQQQQQFPQIQQSMANHQQQNFQMLMAILQKKLNSSTITIRVCFFGFITFLFTYLLHYCIHRAPQL